MTTSSGTHIPGVRLTADVLASFRLYPNFVRPLDEEKRIKSIKFTADGLKLVAASNQNTIELYGCDTGVLDKYVEADYGVNVIDTLHSSDRVLVGSVANSLIRDLNMSTNQIVTKYYGHRKPSTSLAVDLKNNLFVSGGLDKSMLLFDIRTAGSQFELIDLPDVPLVALHPNRDYSCALALEDRRIELRDLRYLAKSSPMVFEFKSDLAKWISLKYSPAGDQMLVSTNGTKVFAFDPCNGSTQITFNSRQNKHNIPIDASFSPCSKFILSGSSDGQIYTINRDENRGQNGDEPKYATLPSGQPEAITSVQICHKHASVATASSYVGFWLLTG